MSRSARNLPNPPNHRKGRVLIYITAALWAVHGGSYVALSSCGRYEPAMIGLEHVKQYEWAPAGFVKDFRRDLLRMRRWYSPPHFLDTLLVHTRGRAFGGWFRINEVAKEDVWKIYKAWR